MFGRHIYRDEAVLRHAQPEPLDDLARVDVPHQYIATRTLGVLCLIALAWLALGSTERALWLQGAATPFERPAAALASQGTPYELMEISSYVPRSTAERLSVGMEVDVLVRSHAKPTSVKGTLVSVEKSAGAIPAKLAATASPELNEPYRLVVEVPASQSIKRGQDLHRLRIVLGQQRLFEFLMNLVMHKLDE